MVLNTKQTTVAYRCPHCGAGVMSAVSPFALRGNMVRLKCTCGQSVMEIEPAGAGKVRFGIYACSPEDSSFTATFTDMRVTECAWKAHDGQAPDEEQ